MKNCPYCKNEHLGGRSFGAHVTNCKMNPKRDETHKKIGDTKRLKRFKYKFNCKKCNKDYELNLSENEFKSNKYKKYCSRECANSHVRTEESKLNFSKIIKQKIRNGEKLGFVKSGSILAEDKPKYYCKKCKKQTKYKNKYELCKQCMYKSSEYIQNLSKSCTGHCGGYREKGGRGKQGHYKGFYLNSSWELAYVIYCLDNKVYLKRNKEGFEYIFENQKFHYYPDFIKEDNSYVEVKGYKDNKYNAKISQFKGKLEIIDKEKIQPYIDYVVKKYGIDFIKLYE